MKRKELTIEQYMAEKRSDIVQADPRSLVIVENLNGREDYGDIEELKAEIRAVGKILNNSIGFRKDGKIHIINGHRRNRAAIELINEGVKFTDANGNEYLLRQPITVLKGIPTELEMIQIMLLSNRGKNFTPLEDANTMLRMLHLGSTPAQIAEAYGKTEAHVSNSLALAKLPQQLKNRINANDISSSLVLNIVRGNKSMTIDQIAGKVEDILEKAKVLGKRVTKSVVDREMNKINSLAELKKVLASMGGDPTNKDLYNFCNALATNQLTGDDIREFLGLPQLETVEA